MAKQTFPQPFGKYILVEKVAMGGMAEIFLGKTIGAEGFEREVAIKRILPHFTEDENFVRMFIDEATIAAKLNHANIVQIFDFDKLDDTYYIAMEYIDGRDLKKLVKRSRKDGMERMNVWQCAFIAMEVAKALHYAHTRTHKGKPLNIVHRDVSPQNVMITFSGEVKLMDFGIAKAAARSTSTRAGTIKGKCAYMSPEQARGKNLDHRSDLFALGVILWEILTYRRLFAGETDFETLSNVLKCDVQPPSRYNPNVPPELDRIVKKALSKDADDRYQNCGVFQRELSRVFYAAVENIEDISLSKLMQHNFAAEIKASHEKEQQENSAASVMSEVVRQQRMSQSRTTGPMGSLPPAGSFAGGIGDGARSAALSNQDLQATMPLSDLQAEALERYKLNPQAAAANQVAMAPAADRSKDFYTSAGAFPPSQTGVRRQLSPVVIAMLILGGLGVLAAMILSFISDQGVVAPAPAAHLEAVSPVTAHTGEFAKVYRLEFQVQPANVKSTVFVNGEAIDGYQVDNLKRGDRLKVYAEANGRRSMEQEVVVSRPRQVVELVVSMNRPPLRQLEIAAAGARISIDGKEMGMDEVEVTEESGKVVAVEADFGEGKIVTREIRIGDVARSVIEPPRPTFGSLVVRVEPKDAVVDVNGVKLLPTDGVVNVPHVRIGEKVQLTVSARRHVTQEKEFLMEAEHQELTFDLEAERRAPRRAATSRGSGTLTLNAKPWAYVIYKGQNLGMTPLTNKKFPAGRVNLTLRHPKATRSVTVTIKEGKHVKRVVNLVP